MGMTEAEFFGQSIIFWRDRLDGFSEMHGGKGETPVDPFGHDDLERLMEEHPDSPPA